jgi:hypothetical protein
MLEVRQGAIKTRRGKSGGGGKKRNKLVYVLKRERERERKNGVLCRAQDKPNRQQVLSLSQLLE